MLTIVYKKRTINGNEGGFMKVINNDYDMNSSHVVNAMGFQIAKNLGTVQNYFNIGKKGFRYDYSKLEIVVQPVLIKTNNFCYYQIQY